MPHKGVKLTSMKLDPKEREKKPETVLADRPVYPWGLTVNLDEESLDKLGMTELPAVGSALYLGANVEVTSVSDSEHTDEGGGTHRHRSVSLQITEMGLGDVDAAVDAGKALYKE